MTEAFLNQKGDIIAMLQEKEYWIARGSRRGKELYFLESKFSTFVKTKKKFPDKVIKLNIDLNQTLENKIKFIRDVSREDS